MGPIVRAPRPAATDIEMVVGSKSIEIVGRPD
jgi:hypothetical protein